MVFNFLPNLPKADLDDRQYADLMQECLSRIPRYCPEWTNHNPSDPGVVLLELFSWLTDQMLTRFNQVPRRNYVTFLELLGIRLQPPRPAQTELTFYLVAHLPDRYHIPTGIEVTTERTATQAAISFSTDAPLTIGQPKIRHLLTADTADEVPGVLRDRFTNFWNRQPSGEWDGPELMLFNEYPEPGNCVYFVFEPDELLDGNVVALTVKGEEATPTGINPSSPPRQWQAWNGHEWQSVLLSEGDDQTQGFSFHELTQNGGNPIQGADVLLHMPLYWPVVQFTAYQGRWLRCVYTLDEHENAPRYSNSPRIIGLMTRAVGGTAPASQSALVEDEKLGESQGTPGQVFKLQSKPILDRRDDEYVVVIPPGGMPQRWQEVADFSGSGPQDPHYVIDAVTGFVQFGPKIHEPSQLRQKAEVQTRYGAMLRGSGGVPGHRGLDGQGFDMSAQPNGSGGNGVLTSTSVSVNAFEEEVRQLDELERQYGAIPAKGAVIRMSRYRTGGGKLGNVRPHRLTSLKSAVPYVARVTNLREAKGGSDAESIEQAAIRVPQLLKTRDRAVTPEDFEALTLQGGKGAIARARCLPPQRAGEVNLLVVPQASLEGIDQGLGVSPDSFALTPAMKTRLFEYLDERRLLGVQILCREPTYVGVTVQTEIVLEPYYHNGAAEAQILNQLRVALYRFLNPITGGRQGTGWQFGQALYASDIVALFQQTPGIQHIGAIQLFELRRRSPENTPLNPPLVRRETGTPSPLHSRSVSEGRREGRGGVNASSQWLRLPPASIINPGPEGLICSWADPQLRSGHIINLLR